MTHPPDTEEIVIQFTVYFDDKEIYEQLTTWTKSNSILI